MSDEIDGQDTQQAPQEEQPWQKEENRKQALIAMTRDEFDKMMVTKFPRIFAQRFLPMTQTCMCWGFDIGNGWHAIVHDACMKLDFLMRRFQVDVVATQIKEKFGTLRFYHHVAPVGDGNSFGDLPDQDASLLCDIVDDVISRTEAATAYACEVCGEHAETESIFGWVTTLCKEHADEYKAERGVKAPADGATPMLFEQFEVATDDAKPDEPEPTGSPAAGT